MFNRSEEIPLEDFRKSRNPSPSSRCSSRPASRSHTPSRLAATDVLLSIPPQENLSINVSSNLLSATNVPLHLEDESDLNSRETSFIAQKKKGNVETV